MCELILRVVDKPAPAAFDRPMVAQAGDVVVVVPDGHQWGREEISNPEWRIVRLPGVAESALADLMEARPHAIDLTRTIAARHFRIRVEEPIMAALIAKGGPIDMTGDAFLALKERRGGDLVERM